MRRSSRIALAMALLLIGVVGFILLRVGDSRAAEMTPETLSQLLQRGKEALEHRDAGGILSLFAPEAQIMGQPPDRLRAALDRTMAELGDGNLTVTLTKPDVRTQTGKAHATFFMDVNGKVQGVNVHYYHSRITLTLEKVHVSHWFDLYRTEEWKISHFESEPPLDMPD